MGEATIAQLQSKLLQYVDTPRTRTEAIDHFHDETAMPLIFEKLVREGTIVIEPGSSGKRWTTRVKANQKKAALAEEGDE